MYVLQLSFLSTLLSGPVPAAEKNPKAWCWHHNTSLVGWYWAVDERCLTWHLGIKGKLFNLGFIRPDNLVSHSLSVLQVQVFCKPKAGFHESFPKERLLSGLSARKPKSVECCSDGCPSGSFSTQDDWSSAKVTTGFLVTSLTKALVRWLISLAGWPAVGVLVASNVFHLGIMEAAVLLGTFWRSRNFFVAFPRSVPQQYPVSELCWQVLWPHGSVVALISTVSCETLYRQVCAFPNHVQSIEFTTGGLKSSWRNTSKMIKRNGTWAKFPVTEYLC